MVWIGYTTYSYSEYKNATILSVLTIKTVKMVTNSLEEVFLCMQKWVWLARISVYKSSHSVLLLCGTCTSTVWKQTSAVLLPQNQNFYNAPEKFLLRCYLSSRIFLIYSVILPFCYLSGRIFLIRQIFCSSASQLIQWQDFLLLCSHLNSSRKPSPESWKAFSCQHINHLPKVQCCLYWTGFTHWSSVFWHHTWFSGKYSRTLVTLLSETLMS